MVVYVVTNPENGWDCVSGVFLSFETLKDYFLEKFKEESDEYILLNNLKTLQGIMKFLDIEEDHHIIHEIDAQ